MRGEDGRDKHASKHVKSIAMQWLKRLSYFPYKLSIYVCPICNKVFKASPLFLMFSSSHFFSWKKGTQNVMKTRVFSGDFAIKKTLKPLKILIFLYGGAFFGRIRGKSNPFYTKYEVENTTRRSENAC